MTNSQKVMPEKSEIINNIKYMVVPLIMWIITMVGQYYGLKQDIKDGNTQANEHITAVANSIARKVDSVQHINEMEFLKLNNRMDNSLLLRAATNK